MIDPKELRIGNWIKYGNDPSLKEDLTNKWVKVTADVIKWASNPSENCYEPIPLTPEILERCGFGWNKHLEVYAKSSNVTGLCIDSELYYVEIDYEGTKERGINVKSIHQLQNLYFALTGEELKIKELQHA